MSLERDTDFLEGVNILFSVLSLAAIFLYHVLASVIFLLIPRSYRKKKDVSGQRVLITGAGNGLGRQLAILFSKKSARLLLLDIDEKALQETSLLLDPGCIASCHVCDVSRIEEVSTVAERIKDEVGDVDILINNAGIVSGKSFIDLTNESIRKTLEVNALSHFWICKAFVPSMMARNSGHIVTVASVAGRLSFPKLADYCASKQAVVGFSESIEIEMRAKNLDGIKVTVVCPGVMNTGLFEGVNSELIKTISVEYAAEETLEGILMEKETVFVPGYLTYLTMLNAIVPRWIYFRYLERTDILNALDSFVGRTKSHNR